LHWDDRDKIVTDEFFVKDLMLISLESWKTLWTQIWVDGGVPSVLLLNRNL
jgi:hypothetical protein